MADLAVKNTAGPLMRYLPRAYRAAGSGTAMDLLTRSLGRVLAMLDHDSKEAMRSWYLDDVSSMTALRKIGALFRLEPWPDDDVELFRTRLKRMIALYLKGAANAERMIELLAVSADMHLAEIEHSYLDLASPGAGKLFAGPKAGKPALLLPRSYACLGQTNVVHITDRFTTMAALQRAGEKARAIVKVEDLPERLYSAIFPAGHYLDLNNEFFGAMADPVNATQEQGVHPRIILTAPEDSALRLPLIIHHGLKRGILINRHLPPGCSICVDLETMRWGDLDKSRPSGSGYLLYKEHAVNHVIFGFAGIWGAPETPFPSGKGETPSLFHLGDSIPARFLSWYDLEDISKEEKDSTALMAAPEPPAKLPWPAWVQHGRQVLQFLVADIPQNHRNYINLHKLRFVRPSAVNQAAEVRIEYHGRQPGSFTVRFDKDELFPPHLQSQALRETRLAWLDEQVKRLKLAGTLYFNQDSFPQELTFPKWEKKEYQRVRPLSEE